MDDRRRELIGQKSLVRPDEVALELQVSTAQIYRLMNHGRLPHLRITKQHRPQPSLDHARIALALDVAFARADG